MASLHSASPRPGRASGVSPAFGEEREVLRVLIGLAFVVSLAGVADAASAPLAVGSVAPAISEPTARGTFDSGATTRPFVVEFFAVWCPHCQREVPVVNELEKTDGSQVDVIAVPASPYGFDHTAMLTPADLSAFAQRFGATYRIGFDGFFGAPFDYGVAEFPTFFVVGADRHIAAVETGEVSFAQLHADVQRALASSR
jgi:thiol-disulfide isomerase/thioredoxin